MKKLMMTMSISAALVSAPAMADEAKAGRSFFGLVSTGITYGGDTMGYMEYTNGSRADLKGGGLFQLGGGFMFRPHGAPYSLIGTINYHVDRANAKNGEATFDRKPLELIGYYHLDRNWRIGAGVRRVLDPKLKMELDGRHLDVDYKDTTGMVMEVGYGVDRAWAGLRYVHEQYEAKHFNRLGRPQETQNLGKQDGSHVGLIGYFAF
ncbi:hypothetical protein [Chitinivorax sp. B]|uniref:hypothetical protein n=1 Tax=Chitinivorax sp. B TaxID=2502235 RepID=UPI0010F6BE92|nr:hypothetical protein [Chitinivorax sp. B]